MVGNFLIYSRNATIQFSGQGDALQVLRFLFRDLRFLWKLSLESTEDTGLGSPQNQELPTG